MRILSKARHVGIWGVGREGIATFEFIKSRYPSIEITFLNDVPLSSDVVTPPDVDILIGDAVHDALMSERFDTIVKSPGISLYRPEVSEAIARDITVTSATNLWFEEYGTANTIVVTGTKGKSTTVRLLQHLLVKHEKRVELVGNVGIPALLYPPGDDYTIFELSSYQIADLRYGPQIAVVTSLYQEHVPWHGSADQYFRDKLRILNIDSKTIGVCNHAIPLMRELVEDDARIHWFNDTRGFRAEDERFFFDDEEIKYQGFALKGTHNLGNLAAACTVLDLLGFTDVRRAVDMTGFAQLRHRLEEFQIQNDVLCVNDSLATLPEATMAALNAYHERDCVLLLGGTERQQDYSDLIEFLANTRVKDVILLPETGLRILDEMKRKGSQPYNVISAKSFEDGVEEALRRVPTGGQILLSPGAPSFGEFRDFAERGDRFKSLCVGHEKI